MKVFKEIKEGFCGIRKSASILWQNKYLFWVSSGSSRSRNGLFLIPLFFWSSPAIIFLLLYKKTHLLNIFEKHSLQLLALSFFILFSCNLILFEPLFSRTISHTIKKKQPAAKKTIRSWQYSYLTIELSLSLGVSLLNTIFLFLIQITSISLFIAASRYPTSLITYSIFLGFFFIPSMFITFLSIPVCALFGLLADESSPVTTAIQIFKNSWKIIIKNGLKFIPFTLLHIIIPVTTYRYITSHPVKNAYLLFSIFFLLACILGIIQKLAEVFAIQLYLKRKQ